VISASSAINHGVGFGHRESKQQGDDCIFHFFILPNDHARDDLRQPRNGANDVAASEHEMNVHYRTKGVRKHRPLYRNARPIRLPRRPVFDCQNGEGPACGQKGREMTGEQCRAARERLNWTRFELAAATNVPVWFIAAFEDGKTTPDFLVAYEVDLRAALESAGAAKARAERRLAHGSDYRIPDFNEHTTIDIFGTIRPFMLNE
jgi:hypothetical protein